MKMPKQSCRNEELERLRHRYASRGKEGKTRLLDEFCEHYRYERKHAIKLLGDDASSHRSGPLRARAGV